MEAVRSVANDWFIRNPSFTDKRRNIGKAPNCSRSLIFLARLKVASFLVYWAFATGQGLVWVALRKPGFQRVDF